ncbi:MAG: galactan 5-O-arabinofuranosyltransferase, partial [Solirubrobacteraceae bacterium]|nr:galactan 5-O-arabinofuranosyltransferase [Solirubrobacteraceae bacterium]
MTSVDFKEVVSEDERHRGLSVVELGIGLATGALAAGLLGVVIHGSNFYALDPTAAGIGPVWAGVMVALALAGYLIQRRAPANSRLVIAGLAGVAAGLAMAPLMAGLHGTPQPPFTVLRGDMTFRTEYVTRFANTWALKDYTFGNLQAFYPPAWFWLAGRAAHYAGIEPWRMVKPFTLGTIAVALGLAFVLWRRVLTPAGALAAAIGSSLVLTRQQGSLGQAAHATQGWYSPYSCFVAVTGVAWLAATLTAVREGASRRGWVFLT